MKFHQRCKMLCLGRSWHEPDGHEDSQEQVCSCAALIYTMFDYDHLGIRQLTDEQVKADHQNLIEGLSNRRLGGIKPLQHDSTQTTLAASQTRLSPLCQNLSLLVKLSTHQRNTSTEYPWVMTCTITTPPPPPPYISNQPQHAHKTTG